MTNITPFIRAWLVSNAGLNALTAGRVASQVEVSRGLPAIRIATTTGGPVASAQAQVDVIERWSVALYVYAGKLSDGRSDLPDTQSAWELVTSIVESAALIGTTPFTAATGERLVRAAVVSAVPGVDLDTGFARATVVLSLDIWR